MSGADAVSRLSPDSGDEVAHPCGVDVLLEASELTAIEVPHVDHLDLGPLAGTLVVQE